MLNLNEFAIEVHANSISKGWWEKDRDFAEICSLIHSEWSEALEEARANHNMIWTGENGKPEGIAVELIDGVIRILDWIGKEHVQVYPATIDLCLIWGKKLQNKLPLEETLPQLVARLHCYTSNAYSEYDNEDRGDYLIGAMQTVFYWLDLKGVDIENVLTAKHEFNKTRPYKHGKIF